MARIVYGACGTAWRAPEWIFRNLGGELLATTKRSALGAHVASRIEAALANAVAVVDLTELLSDPATLQTWLAALDASFSILVREGAEGWNDPSAFVSAIASIRSFVDAEHARSSVTALACDAQREDSVFAAPRWMLDGDSLP